MDRFTIYPTCIYISYFIVHTYDVFYNVILCIQSSKNTMEAIFEKLICDSMKSVQMKCNIIYWNVYSTIPCITSILLRKSQYCDLEP